MNFRSNNIIQYTPPKRDTGEASLHERGSFSYSRKWKRTFRDKNSNCREFVNFKGHYERTSEFGNALKRGMCKVIYYLRLRHKN